MERHIFEYGDRVVILTVEGFDTEVDINDILRIDYGNIIGEVLTFPLVFNRIANLKAEMEEIVSKTKLDFEIFEAQLLEEKRKKLEATSDKKVTIQEVETSMKLDSRYRLKKENLFKVQKNFAYIDSLYWSAQSKDTKLNRLSEKFTPGEFEKELIESSINGVLIKFSKKVIN